mmetsp:Transcript_26638/g.76949  ORF Transcript_26638/g.76949 Transcript_26638/m.76949 type:complete len:341 (+) Transcript_26638:67-1089(+)
MASACLSARHSPALVAALLAAMFVLELMFPALGETLCSEPVEAPCVSSLLQVQVSQAPRLEPDMSPEGHRKLMSALSGLRTSPNTHMTVYFVAMPPGANNRHNITHYINTLSQICAALPMALDPARNVTASFLGSVEWVRQHVPMCKKVFDGQVKSKEVAESTFGFKEVERFIRPSCRDKHTSNHVPQFGKLVKIWLNKVSLACAVAEQHPDDVSLFMDANIIRSNVESYKRALRAPSVLATGTVGMMRYSPEMGPKWPSVTGHHWFGNRNCTTPAIFVAKWMAVRGRDCPRFMANFHSAYQSLLADNDCGCFDEEIVLSKMGLENPELFDWQQFSNFVN